MKPIFVATVIGVMAVAGASAQSQPANWACATLNTDEISAASGMTVSQVKEAPSFVKYGKYACSYTVDGNARGLEIKFETAAYIAMEHESGDELGDGTVKGRWDAGKKWMKKRYPIVQIDGLGEDAYYYPMPVKTSINTVYVLLSDMEVSVASQIVGQKELEAMAHIVIGRLTGTP